MIIDSSALISIRLGEQEAELFALAIGRDHGRTFEPVGETIEM